MRVRQLRKGHNLGHSAAGGVEASNTALFQRCAQKWGRASARDGQDGAQHSHPRRDMHWVFFSLGQGWVGLFYARTH